MVLRDLDILKKINEKSYLNVGWSIITADDDETRSLFEPKAPSVASRFEAMKTLFENKILTGTIFMPILPFIYDSRENIESVVKKTKECGGQYVLASGLTLFGYCKNYFYKTLEKYNPELISKYDELYKNPKLLAEQEKRIHQLVLDYCKKYELTPYIKRPISFYPANLQINKKIAEKFYYKARELQLSGENSYKEWAYRKAAWSLDELGRGIDEIYNEQGINGIMQIKGVGKSIGGEIEEFLESHV